MWEHYQITYIAVRPIYMGSYTDNVLELGLGQWLITWTVQRKISRHHSMEVHREEAPITGWAVSNRLYYQWCTCEKRFTDYTGISKDKLINVIFCSGPSHSIFKYTLNFKATFNLTGISGEVCENLEQRFFTLLAILTNPNQVIWSPQNHDEFLSHGSWKTTGMHHIPSSSTLDPMFHFTCVTDSFYLK